MPADVLRDVSRHLGTDLTVLERLPGGVNGGALRIRRTGATDVVLKTAATTHAGLLEETRRAERVVEHVRAGGYPTPAWLGVGATDTHVWHVMDHVDAAPAPQLTALLLQQLVEVVELQAGQASVSYDHGAHAWRIATGRASGPPDETPEQGRLRRSIATLPGRSPAVAVLVERLRRRCARVAAPTEAPDMVHADLATPGNVLVRDGLVVAVVDLGNAGCGTRATDLTALAWYAGGEPPLDGVRRRLWTLILDLVGEDRAAVLGASQVLHALEVAVRLGRPDAVPGVVEQGHRAVDELAALA